jgi:hypothetical protein
MEEGIPIPPGVAVPAACIVLALLVPAPAAAQKLYKCQKDGKVFFSNAPCAGTAGSVQASSPLPSNVTTLAGPAPGRAYSPDDKELLTRIQKELPELTARCEAGDQQVCALLDCVLKADRAACARAEGRLAGRGWREVARKENRVKEQDGEGGERAFKELEITVECRQAKDVRSVYWRDEGWVYLRDGPKVTDPATGRTDREPGSRFTSIEAAAEAACGIPPEGPGGEP